MIKSPAGLASREAHKKIDHFNCNRPRGCCQMKKYELTEETINVFGKTLHRIRATRDFSNVHAGDLGGFIENELNLSHDRDTWVYGNAWAYGEARVYGNALVSGEARVYGNALVSGDARVYGNALVSGDARVEGKALVGGDALVYGKALVGGNAWAYGKALVGGNAWAYGEARVYGNALVSGDARVCGKALVKGTRDIYWISCIGSRDGTTTFFRNADNGISVSCGCFYGTIDEFAAAVTKTHGDNEHAQAYRHAIEIAKLRIKLEDAES